MRRRMVYPAFVLLVACLIPAAAEGAYETSDDASAYPDLLPPTGDTGIDFLSEYWKLLQQKLLPTLEAASKEGTSSAGTNGSQATSSDRGASEKTGTKPNAPVAPTAPSTPSAGGSKPSSDGPNDLKTTPSRSAATAVESPAVPSSPSVPAVSLSEETPTRELKVRKGDEVTISLEGSGWIFLGERLARSGLVFKQRELEAEKADFRFSAKEEGDYLLSFQRQLLSTGGSVKELVKVTVAEQQIRPSGGAPSAVQGGAAVASAGSSSSKVPTASQTSDASASAARSSASAAPSTRNASGTASAATAGTGTAAAVSATAAAGSGEGTGSTVPPAVAAPPMSPAEQADATLKSDGAAAAASFIENYLGLNPGDESADLLLFKLAGYYEREKAVRDLRKSVALYRRILSDFPFSGYYDAASERLEYLTRHFFYLR